MRRCRPARTCAGEPRRSWSSRSSPLGGSSASPCSRAEPNQYLSGAEGFSVLVLGGLLFPMLLVGLAIVKVSGRLKRGVSGAMVMVLIVPFIYLVVVAGLCVATTQPFS